MELPWMHELVGAHSDFKTILKTLLKALMLEDKFLQLVFYSLDPKNPDPHLGERESKSNLQWAVMEREEELERVECVVCLLKRERKGLYMIPNHIEDNIPLSL